MNRDLIIHRSQYPIKLEVRDDGKAACSNNFPDIALARLLNVGATPSFFVNGILVRGGMPPQFFDGLIAMELKKAAK